jgi:hypothetical protein
MTLFLNIAVLSVLFVLLALGAKYTYDTLFAK